MKNITTHPAPERCAHVLKVLSDATRLAVMELLMDGPEHVSDMTRKLDVEQSLLSHHLRVLREAGLVTTRRHGKSVLYRLADSVESARRANSLDLGCCQLAFAKKG